MFHVVSCAYLLPRGAIPGCERLNAAWLNPDSEVLLVALTTKPYFRANLFARVINATAASAGGMKARSLRRGLPLAGASSPRMRAQDPSPPGSGRLARCHWQWQAVLPAPEVGARRRRLGPLRPWPGRLHSGRAWTGPQPRKRAAGLGRGLSAVPGASGGPSNAGWGAGIVRGSDRALALAAEQALQCQWHRGRPPVALAPTGRDTATSMWRRRTEVGNSGVRVDDCPCAIWRFNLLL